MTEIRNLIFQCIADSEKPIEESDLRDLQKEYVTFIENYLASCSNRIFETILEKRGINNFLWKTGEESPKIVIVGDIHCDLTSLSGIFQKLSLSKYNYFEKAYFVFLGDYIDRGVQTLETLRFIFKLKQLLGERCILLRGNHDDFYLEDNDEAVISDRQKGTYYSNVKPAETIELMNKYFEKDTISKFRDFFEALPFFAIAERNQKRYLLVHGGIPKDVYTEEFSIEKLADERIPLSGKEENQRKLNRLLNSMLWGDPKDAKFKINDTHSRFEFGSEQFEKFKEKINISYMVRGHEPKAAGFESKYNDQLFTVFSSGGTRNQNSYYSDDVPSPSFAIIDEEGNIRAESIFTYKIMVRVDDEQKLNNLKKTFFAIKPGDDDPYELEIELLENFTGKSNENANCILKFLNSEFYISISLSALPLFLKGKFSKLLEV